MDSEFRQLAGRMAERTESSDGLFTYTHGRIGRNEVVLMQCGIGKVNAAAGTLRLTDRHRPHCVLSTGVAGGIDPCLGVADMVAGSRTVYVFLSNRLCPDVWNTKLGDMDIMTDIQELIFQSLNQKKENL